MTMMLLAIVMVMIGTVADFTTYFIT